MKRRNQKGGEGMFDNLLEKAKGLFTANTNEQPENNNTNQDSLESAHSTESIQDNEEQNNEGQNNIVEKSENKEQQGGKTKKKKKS